MIRSGGQYLNGPANILRTIQADRTIRADPQCGSLLRRPVSTKEPLAPASAFVHQGVHRGTFDVRRCGNIVGPVVAGKSRWAVWSGSWRPPGGDRRRSADALGMRYIPNNRVGIVEKLWSRGSVPEGQIIALNGEAGFQADLLRGGMHFGYWRWQYRIHKVPLVTIPQGKIGYVYARDGEPLQPSQTLGRVVDVQQLPGRPRRSCGRGSSPDGEPVLGQRGRQRAILREGVYAINLALFVVITEDAVYRLDVPGPRELQDAGQLAERAQRRSTASTPS